MTAKNMKQLNNMLMKQLNKAMFVASEKMLADMYDETGKFYTKGKPKYYVRTGALGDTPRTTAVTTSVTETGGQASFEAYLDKSVGYSTGKSPSMEAVLNLANYGISPLPPNHLRATLGKKGFWERAEKKMERSFKQTMKRFFK